MPCTSKIAADTYKIVPEGNNVKLGQVVVVMPVAFPFVGGSFGWLGWYIICSIPLVIIMRKFMKIYM